MWYRKIKLKNINGKIKCEDETVIISNIVKAVVPMGNKGNFEYTLNLKEINTKKKYNYNNEINPYNPDMNKINYFMPSINGQIISCEYEIKVSLYFDCFVDYNHRPRVIIPIYLVHQLPIDYQLEIQEQIDFENALKKSKMEEEDNKYFNNKLMKNKDNYNNKMDNMNEIEEDNELPSLEQAALP